MTTLELAVIVPCHNEEHTLPAQLDALTAEEWDGNWEIVVVDNESTDRTALVARDFAGRGVHVRVVSAVAGRGVSYSRNAGVASTGARTVAFCDGDDVIQAGWVGAMGEALRTHDLATGPVEAHSLNEKWLARTRPLGNARGLPLFGSVPFARGNNTGMTRSLWEVLGGYREDFLGLEDIEMSLRAAAHGVTPVLVDDAVVAYRYRPGVRALWRQGLFYGRGRPALAAMAAGLGLGEPSRWAGLRSWAWLVRGLPGLVTRTGRHGWVWVLANRVGVLQGAFVGGRKIRYLFV